jgi:hypothetical protein
MAREINAGIDALFVEGTDDGAVVNAFVKKRAGIDLAKPRLLQIKSEGGGHAWALTQFDKYVAEAREGARVGVIVDRDAVENDKWPAVRQRLVRLGGTFDAPSPTGAIVGGRYGIWMWPDNVSHGDLETFVAGLLPPSPVLNYAAEACRVARELHGAEYDPGDDRKATLKVRSVWRDARVAGGYGHLVRNLPLVETPASVAFLAWFEQLYLT